VRDHTATLGEGDATFDAVIYARAAG
jgi:hypothetical protein